MKSPALKRRRAVPYHISGSYDLDLPRVGPDLRGGLFALEYPERPARRSRPYLGYSTKSKT